LSCEARFERRVLLAPFRAGQGVQYRRKYHSEKLRPWGRRALKSQLQENAFDHCLFFGKHIIMEITAVIFKRSGRIKDTEEKDDIKFYEIPRTTKGYLSSEILKEVGTGCLV